MQRVDFVIIALVVVAVVGSAIGVAWYDSDGVTRYEIQVTQHDGSEPQWTPTLTGPQGSDSESWDIGTQNLTEITFTLSISSSLTPRSTDTEVTFEISHPDANISTRTETLTIPQSAADGSDEVTVPIPIQDVPAGEDRVLASNEDDALQGDGQPFVPTTTNGTGEWTVNADVTMGGSSAVVGDQSLGDENIEVIVTVEYRFYRAEARPHVPDISPAG